ncbi:hypothetical protein GCM10020000_81760 [Streptomyces olivoverticillatus]
MCAGGVAAYGQHAAVVPALEQDEDVDGARTGGRSGFAHAGYLGMAESNALAKKPSSAVRSRRLSRPAADRLTFEGVRKGWGGRGRHSGSFGQRD